MKEKEPKTEKDKQTTDTIVMVSPDTFGFNPETATTNRHSYKPTEDEETIKQKAMHEFCEMKAHLEKNGINLIVLQSKPDVITKDAVFPNNWVSHHQDGKLIIYPMLNDSRRVERQPDNLISKLTQNGTKAEILDLSNRENKTYVLEGTGSLVLDRNNKVVYACESPRTSKNAFEDWCALMSYKGIFFHANYEDGGQVYHTNVVMSVGEKFAVVCLESIRSTEEQSSIISELEKSGRQIIPINLKQLYSYCGNIIELKNIHGMPKIGVSKTAFEGYSPSQLDILRQHGELIVDDISTIEKYGGGSWRCMVAEIF